MRRIKKAILTGGGRATRLRPITSTINKHLIPLANKPMIFHAIDKAVEVGVEQIFINTNPGETTIPDLVGDGGHWGITITYFEQRGGPLGIAHAVKEAERFIGDDPFMFYLSDNIFLGKLDELIQAFQEGSYDCMLTLSTVPDPQRFGVPYFDEEGRLVDVVEKPQDPPNSFAVTGLYLYGPRVFFEAFSHIQPSNRGEYEISSIHSYFLKHGYSVGCKEVTGMWKDTGKPDDLILTNQLLLKELPQARFTRPNAFTEHAGISGDVHIGAGTTIGENVRIIGPAIIGENCTLEECIIEPHTTVGAGSTIKNARIGDSIIFNNCEIECDAYIHQSIIGQNVRVRKKQEEQKRLILGDHTSIEL